MEPEMLAALNSAYDEAGPTEIDLNIGRKLRRRRRILGLTQAEVANAIGVQFQQVQKYECAANRLSAARLYELSRVLGVPMNYFYEGLSSSGAGGPAISSSAQLLCEEDLERDETLELIRTASKIPDRARRALWEFARSLEESATAEDKQSARKSAATHRGSGGALRSREEPLAVLREHTPIVLIALDPAVGPKPQLEPKRDDIRGRLTQRSLLNLREFAKHDVYLVFQFSAFLGGIGGDLVPAHRFRVRGNQLRPRGRRVQRS